VSDIQNPNAVNGLDEWIFASAQLNGIETGCSFNGCIYNFVVTPWAPGFTFAQNEEILDSSGVIHAVSTPGTSGATAPTWIPATGGTNTDNGVTWLTLGTLTSTTPLGWVSGHSYHHGVTILDKNNNIEYCSHAGTSGGAVPSWPAKVGNTIPDGATLVWTNLGAFPSAALVAPGGTTGIIMDNVVPSSTLAGGSQIYFSTLSSESCTGGSGSCAVQASQPGLK